MKKLDFVVIGITLLFILFLSIIFIENKDIKTEDLKIEIVFKGEKLLTIDMDNNRIYYIECDNNNLIIKTDNDILKTIQVESHNFKNTFEIKDKKVVMIDADCPGKDCTKMYISPNHLVPIICINGIVINPTSSSNIDVIA